MPLALIVAVPLAGCVTSVTRSVSPSTSVSLASTAMVTGVSSSVMALSSTGDRGVVDADYRDRHRGNIAVGLAVAGAVGETCRCRGSWHPGCSSGCRRG